MAESKLTYIDDRDAHEVQQPLTLIIVLLCHTDGPLTVLGNVLLVSSLPKKNKEACSVATQHHVSTQTYLVQDMLHISVEKDVTCKNDGLSHVCHRHQQQDSMSLRHLKRSMALWKRHAMHGHKIHAMHSVTCRFIMWSTVNAMCHVSGACRSMAIAGCNAAKQICYCAQAWQRHLLLITWTKTMCW